MSDEGIAAQFTATKARDERGDRLWIARATSSFPVPVSPTNSRVIEIVRISRRWVNDRAHRRRRQECFAEKLVIYERVRQGESRRPAQRAMVFRCVLISPASLELCRASMHPPAGKRDLETFYR